MPTEYTVKILHGMSFEQFALRCARAMSINADLRDEPWDTPLAQRIPNSVYAAKLEWEKQLLAALQTMNTESIELAAQDAYTQAVENWKRSVAENSSVRDRYYDVLNRVHAWHPPTPNHEHLKSFMIQQICDSIHCDCVTLPEPIAETPDAWLKRKIATAEQNIAMYTVLHAEEVQRITARNIWNAELLDSLSKREIEQ